VTPVGNRAGENTGLPPFLIVHLCCWGARTSIRPRRSSGLRCSGTVRFAFGNEERKGSKPSAVGIVAVRTIVVSVIVVVEVASMLSDLRANSACCK
jgi:hypothetical protein